MQVTESQEHLVEDNTPELQCHVPPEPTVPGAPLTPTEKKYLMYAERGDCASLRRYIHGSIFCIMSLEHSLCTRAIFFIYNSN